MHEILVYFPDIAASPCAFAHKEREARFTEDVRPKLKEFCPSLLDFIDKSLELDEHGWGSHWGEKFNGLGYGSPYKFYAKPKGSPGNFTFVLTITVPDGADEKDPAKRPACKIALTTDVLWANSE